MQIGELWRDFRHSQSCRIFHVVDEKTSIETADLESGIFSLDIDEQPVMVIDNTADTDGLSHNTVNSELVEIDEMRDSKIRFEVAMLEFVPGSSVNSSTVIIRYFSEDRKKIFEEKVTHKIFLRESKEVEIPISTLIDASFFSISIFVNRTNRLSVCYSGFSVESESTEELEEGGEYKKVTMTVFNNFRNDTRVLREAKSLLELGFRVRIMAIFSTGQKEEEYIEGIRVSRVILTPFHLRWIRWWERRKIARLIIPRMIRLFFMPFHRYIMFFEFEKKVIERLEDDESDVYHAHDLNTLRLGWKISSIHGKKLVYDSHELYLDRNRSRKAGPIKRMMIRRFEKSLIRKCDKVITVNESIAELLCRRYGISDVEVIMNTPPMQFFPPENIGCDLREILRISDDKKIAIYVGSIQRNRGLENLLRSMIFLDSVHLVLMGYGDKEVLDELERIATKNGLSDRYSLFGPVPSELVPLYTSSADIGVAPILNSCLSYYLCSPNKVFEYMHAGIPVVASDFPELRRVVIGENMGSVFDPESPEDIARSIEEIIGNEQLCDQFRLNSNNSSRKYNWGLQSTKLQSLYIDLFPNQRIEGSSDFESSSKIERLFLTNGGSRESWLELENSMPGSRGWGSPRGRESFGRFRALLNSMLFRTGDTLIISSIAKQKSELRASIYRIGHYGGVGSRKLADLGKKEILGLGGEFDHLEIESANLDPIFSTELGSSFPPGSYVVNIGDEENSATLPFWIYGEGDVLAVVPTIANRVRHFPNDSKERAIIYTHGFEDSEDIEISGNVNYIYPNGRGGEVTKWVFPFCRWAERKGIHVSWITDVELDKYPEEIEKFRKVVLVGDSRFWTENIHTAIGVHVSSGTILANIGCGMGEQLIQVDEGGNFSFQNLNYDNNAGPIPICETWGRGESPQRFGGITENEILLNATSDGENRIFPLLGTWDRINFLDGNYIGNEVLSLSGETVNSGIVEVVSREIRSHSGATVFLASMENWCKVLEEGSEIDPDLAKEQNQYLSDLLTNETSSSRDELRLIRDSMSIVAREHWGGEPMSRQSELTMTTRKVNSERVCILTTIWKRRELTSAFLAHINFLKEELPEFHIDCLVVGSEGDETRQMVISSGNQYLEHPNLPLSEKWDAGLKFSENFDPDAVIILGSDDFISPETIRELVGRISRGWLMTGLMDMHVLDSKSNQLFHWNGYSVSAPHRMWETIGLGRCLSRKLLEKVDFSLWGSEQIDRGLDGLMTSKLASVGLIPVPLGQEVWIMLEDGEFAFGHSGLYSSDIDGFVVDVKTEENITLLEKYNVSEVNEVKNWLPGIRQKIGEDATEIITSMGRSHED